MAPMNDIGVGSKETPPENAKNCEDWVSTDYDSLLFASRRGESTPTPPQQHEKHICDTTTIGVLLVGRP